MSMDREEVSEFRTFRNIFLSIFCVVVLVGMAAAGVSRVAGLAWFPWEVQQQTSIVRNSNGYVTTQIAALRQLQTSYEFADTPNQKAAIVMQMRGIADSVSGEYIPSDISRFLSTH